MIIVGGSLKEFKVEIYPILFLKGNIETEVQENTDKRINGAGVHSYTQIHVTIWHERRVKKYLTRYPEHHKHKENRIQQKIAFP